MFAKKLDFLMTIAGISNAQLAMEMHMDPSYISRLRSGKRKFPKHAAYLNTLLAYLTIQLQQPAQRVTLQNMLQISLPENQSDAEQFISDWLFDEVEENDMIHQLLREISQPLKTPPLSTTEILSAPLQHHGQFYVDADGKREAVMLFFRYVLHSPTPLTLKLFSEEEMGWLFEDAAFLLQWRTTLSQILAQGHRIITIHTVARNLDELMAAVTQWLPIYMTGAITPHYFARKRDGISQRTIFLAPGVAAISSNAVMMNSSGMLNTLVTDRTALEALEKEFDAYLKLCRPLMTVSTGELTALYPGMLLEVLQGQADVYYQSSYPSPYTLPRSLAQRLEDGPQPGFLKTHEDVQQALKAALAQHAVYDIIPNPKTALATTPTSRFVYGNLPNPFVYAADLIAHYKEILRLLETYDHYHVYFSDDANPNLNIFLNLNQCVFVERFIAPPILFNISEQNMHSAFLYHLQDACRLPTDEQRQRSIRLLRQAITDATD